MHTRNILLAAFGLAGSALTGMTIFTALSTSPSTATKSGILTAQAETEPCPGVAPLPFLVSQNANGEEGNNDSLSGTISENGCVIAFTSYASNLVPGDTNNFTDIFVFDRSTGKLSRVSMGLNSAEANGNSSFPALSEDGRYVAFQSNANNLVARDTNGWGDVFVYDRLLGATTRLTGGNDDSYLPSISLTGRYVAFKSQASNLVENDTNGFEDVFVRDIVDQKTYRVSVDSNGKQGEPNLCNGIPCAGISLAPPAIRGGRYIAFDSDLKNLVTNDTNGQKDVFLHHFGSGITERVSETAEGLQGNDESKTPAIDATGRYVVFETFAPQFPGLKTFSPRLYMRDGATKMLTFIDGIGTSNSWSGDGPSVSGDGRFTIYRSHLSKQAIMAFDQLTGEKWLVSVNGAGESPNNESTVETRAMSGSGTWTVFSSRATNLNPYIPPTNFQYQVYLTTTKLAF